MAVHIQWDKLKIMLLLMVSYLMHKNDLTRSIEKEEVGVLTGL